jgi:hypothetical protein
MEIGGGGEGERGGGGGGGMKDEERDEAPPPKLKSNNRAGIYAKPVRAMLFIHTQSHADPPERGAPGRPRAGGAPRLEQRRRRRPRERHGGC